MSFSRRLQDLADQEPDEVSVICGAERVTRGELVERIDDLAVELAGRGVNAGDMVTIALPNSV